MERTPLIEAMKTSISDVLETMFFMPLEFSDPVELGPYVEDPAKELLGSKLDFGGPFSGSIFLLLPSGLAQVMTANFLGEEKERVTRNQVTDTIKEIVNMITGKMFSVYDHEAIFELGLPVIIDPPEALAERPAGAEDEILISVDTVDASLVVKMTLNS